MRDKPDWMVLSETAGNVCPHLQRNGKLTCLFHSARGPLVCNMLADETSGDKIGEGRRCGNLFDRMCGVHDLMPELWADAAGESSSLCCEEWRMLMLKCVEESGYMAGGVDIRIYPNDGKDVWRNYYRTRFRFCPYCGHEKGTALSPRQSGEAQRIQAVVEAAKTWDVAKMKRMDYLEALQDGEDDGETYVRTPIVEEIALHQAVTALATKDVTTPVSPRQRDDANIEQDDTNADVTDGEDDGKSERTS